MGNDLTGEEIASSVHLLVQFYFIFLPKMIILNFSSRGEPSDGNVAFCHIQTHVNVRKWGVLKNFHQ